MGIKKSVLLTFDYELFLSESGSPNESLFNPTSRLIELFKKYGVNAVFYIDILYYHKMLEIEAEKENCRKFVSQIQELVINGHNVELHLHPHWMDAVYKNGKWDLSNVANYKLSSLTTDQVGNLFDIGVKLLTEICTPVKSDYKIKAFRAGGLCVLPFDKLLPSFVKHNIKMDSSIASGHYKLKGIDSYDYRLVNYNYSYKFNDSPVNKDIKGAFIEIPLHWFWVNFFNKIEMKLNTKNNSHNILAQGVGIPTEDYFRTFVGKFLWKFKRNAFFYSFDHSEIPYHLLLRKINKSKSDVVVFLNHPKLMSEKSFLEMESLFKNENYKILNFENNYLNKTLILITAAFPYGAGEAFLETELPYLTREFKKVVVFTRGSKFGNGFPIDPNIEVHKLTPLKHDHIFSVLFSFNFLIDICNYLFNKNTRKSLKGIKYIFSFFQEAHFKKQQINKFLIKAQLENSPNLVICSNWMIDDALAVALLRKENKTMTGVAKAHGYDVYEDRNSFHFLAGRKILKRYLDKLFFISESGKLHFSKKHGESDKYEITRLGVRAQHFKQRHLKETFNIVSCSYIHPIKRVDLLISSLAKLNSSINWVHIGNALDDKVWNETVKHAQNSLKGKNIQYNLLGYMDNAEVEEFYKNSDVDVFINISSSEGIPVTIMEAMSFGIPVISTKVGGVPEIVVDGYNGYLLNANPTDEEVALKIEEFKKMSPASTESMRKNAYNTWKLKYNAEINYTSFVKILTS
ncbi:MAG: glycosyltransferase [Bacteroidota bacterium]